VIARLPGVLRELGVEPARALGPAVGVDPAALEDPDLVLPVADVQRLLEAAAEASGCAHLGALLGRAGGTATLGPVGALMRSAPTLRNALIDLCEHQPRHVRRAVAYLHVRGDVAVLGYTAFDGPPRVVATTNEGAVAIGINLLRELAGVAPEQVLLRRARPADARAHAAVFGVTPRFEAEENALCLPRRVLDAPLATADAEARARLQRMIAAYQVAGKASAAEQVRRMLFAGVTAGQTSLPDVARSLWLHPRTLHRQLKAEGTRFRRLVDDARRDTACQLLSWTGLPVTSIALALGYEDTANFTRAFRRWTGAGPAAWRRDTRAA
jgi:AraC-like DNA-binding protein